MPEEQLKAFLEAVKADAGLQEKLKAAKDADAVVEIAKAAGFVISAEDYKIAEAEISEEELEGVHGGQGCGVPKAEGFVISAEDYKIAEAEGFVVPPMASRPMGGS